MKERFGFRGRVCLVALLIMVGLVAAFVLPPLRQPQGYHQFADQGAVVGIPNFLNVVSNGPFLLVGLMGLWFLAQKRQRTEPGGFIESSERWAYVVFFLGVILTGFGSAYYHWRPSNYLWCLRIPITIVARSKAVEGYRSPRRSACSGASDCALASWSASSPLALWQAKVEAIVRHHTGLHI